MTDPWRISIKVMQRPFKITQHNSPQNFKSERKVNFLRAIFTGKAERRLTMGKTTGRLKWGSTIIRTLQNERKVKTSLAFSV